MAKILLIEDDPLVIKMYRNVLSFEGFQMETAPNGAEGMKKAKEFLPDLIFLDIMMPKMNGIEVLENLKNDPALKEIPVIMLTNLAGAENAEEALKKGAFAYMVKSEYKPKEVAEKAKEFFDKQGVSSDTTSGGGVSSSVNSSISSPAPAVAPSDSMGTTESSANLPKDSGSGLRDEVKMEPPKTDPSKPASMSSVPGSSGVKGGSSGDAPAGKSSTSAVTPSSMSSAGQPSDDSSKLSSKPSINSDKKPGGSVKSSQPPPPKSLGGAPVSVAPKPTSPGATGTKSPSIPSGGTGGQSSSAKSSQMSGSVPSGGTKTQSASLASPSVSSSPPPPPVADKKPESTSTPPTAGSSAPPASVPPSSSDKNEV